MPDKDHNELAWAAGFFDVEGCCVQSHPKSKYNYVRLRVTQIEKQPLERFHKAVGAGNIKWITHQQYTNGGTWSWQVSGKQAKIVIQRLLWFLSEPKRKQIKKVMKLAR